jgi:GrpB-like predicted nucleotidyltransferase (UPF0157 family)
VTRGWPAWATAPVEVAPADPTWAVRAASLRRSLEPLLASWLEGPIEHIGSTSVPGLPAKPIVDLMAPVGDLASLDGADAVLERAGWSLVPPDLDGRSWRRLYVLPEGDRRLAHLHLVEPTHTRWQEALRFRDALREDAALAEQYARIKRQAAQDHRDDREAYTEAKGAFVERVLQRQDDAHR